MSWTDFWNTARITPVRGFDAAGDDISAGMQARSVAGCAYAASGPLVTTTPEPATAVLLGCGLAACALVARRARMTRG